ncbi:zinc-binding alcohol dehydrogenase family protein [Microbulbifer sp. YPW1]|uniref:zinc-binding alcohol dehydrogenase family protein n=1 Tax=Microbulbifer sp. YPW1 TaxID=2745199 RepID=UPI00159A899C|nr:zinc-binding alcohol dehydrogenase family protein [Microbulbifer sp. YPW1]QKX19034.1 zinc-binding alcohol dehydrogenase family protein [Microbulbifer sp. YPW1]
MKAIGYRAPGPIGREDALIDFEKEKPLPEGMDLLVNVEAVSVNPVDYKIRQGVAPEGNEPKILGWDAVGIVAEVGDKVTGFKSGDKVWYAGAVNRDGTNAEYHLVDERIVALAPTSVPSDAAAALPLTALTAYEMLFDRLKVSDPVPGAANTILIIGGAGGVGSIAIQLLRALTDITVIATASRSETEAWVKELGAHYVVDHRKPLPPQIEALGVGAPAFVFSTNHSDAYIPQVAELIAPQGHFGLIDDPEVVDVVPLKTKAVSTHWELMFTRSLFATEDMARQGEILQHVAKLLDEGKLKSTASVTLGLINAANLKRAHAILESGKAKGKLVLEGF